MSDSRCAQALRSRVERFPLFEPAEYARVNPDAGASPLEHLLEQGLREGRYLARPEKVAALLSTLVRTAPARRSQPDAAAMAAVLAKASALPIQIVASQSGPADDRLAAEQLAAGLNGLGALAQVRGGSDGSDDPEAVTILVGQDGFDRHRVASSVVFSAAAPYETGFFRQLEPLLRARGVISPDAILVQLCQAAGIASAFWLPSGASAADEPMPDDPLLQGLCSAVRRPSDSTRPWRDRPVDLMLIVDESEVRGEFLGRHGDLFSQLRCVVRYRRALWTLAGEPLIDPATADFIARRCKIVLNLHEGEVGALQPRWITHGMAQGALVVSAPCLPHPLLRPGAHYLEDSLGRLPKLIAWLLRTPEGAHTAERVRAEAASVLAEQASSRRLSFGVLELLAAVSTPMAD